VLSQDDPKAWVRARTSTSAPFTPGPKVISGADAVIPVGGLRLELPMAEIYAGVATG
jgi:hypothetical protein